MRRRFWFAAALLVIAGAVVQAQSSTADGFEAFVRGDYQTAAAILKPIAETSPQPDYAAKFLMGALYENGLGVPADRARACVSYMHAADPRGGSPFAVAAGSLLREMFLSMPKEEFENCEFFASLGFDHGFQPATFALDQGHSISWDLKGATISYNGKETRVPRMLGQGYGTMFLPLQHTVLLVGPSRSTRRHFIEVAAWAPARATGAWSLVWVLFEVVGDDLIDITRETPLTIVGRQPPVTPPFDVHEFATVRANDEGDAEWTVVDGQIVRTEIIELDAVRQEQQERKLARAAAEAQVDWRLERDVQRVPELTYADGDGCGSAFVYGWSADRTEVMAVRADTTLLQLSTTPQSFDIAAAPAGLDVVVHVYERPLRSMPFCTDHGGPVREETWRAAQGSVTIELSPRGVRRREPHLYRATIRIARAEFTNSAGVRVQQRGPITLAAIVGAMLE